MKNVMAGKVVASTTTPTLHLGTYRRSILRLIVGSPLFTAQEQLLASHNVHECEDSAKLALWLKNVRRVFVEREAVLAQADLAGVSEVVAPPVRYATATQTSELQQLALHRALSDRERTKVLLALPRLKEYEAQALIGELWAKLLHRSGGTPPGDASAAVSFSSAA